MAASTVTKTGGERRGELGIGSLEYYGVRDYKRLLVRTKWTLISITLVVAIITAAVAYLLPNQYKASTVIQVDPSKVAESFVKSTATVSAGERLALLQQQILSNTRLSQVIDEMGLYSDLKKTDTPDEILLQMRKDTLVEPITFGGDHELEAFKITYISKDANTAARVTNRIASLFIEENLKSREQQVMGTAEFFTRELQEAKQDLAEKAKKLEALRARYFSELPESQSVHVQTLTSLQLNLRGEMDSISRAQQQKVYLESLMAATPPVVDLDSSSADDGTSGMQQQLAHLEEQLDQLRARYGQEFPDVKKKQTEVNEVKQQIAAQQKVAHPGPKPQPVARRQNPVIESQIAALDQEIKAHEQRERELQSQIAFHESKLAGAPAVAGQLAAATREYDNAEDNYKRLQDHKFLADVSSDVESRQKGERFVILEPAQPPSRPFAPNRPVIDLLGLAAGIPLAVLMVLGLEVIDMTIKTRRELTTLIAAPVLGEIPWLATGTHQHSQRARSVFAFLGNTVLALSYLALLGMAVR
ncbi:MAG TPA: Wzz/FepE/Etk N-terminal domain-containing protein [Terriglobales bacterium]|nr:Wzz/FepE/Etk N-terminal domain-containing protein [Terriglobales bacterium]